MFISGGKETSGMGSEPIDWYTWLAGALL